MATDRRAGERVSVWVAMWAVVFASLVASSAIRNWGIDGINMRGWDGDDSVDVRG